MKTKKTLSDLFNDIIDSQGISIEKLASTSNVPLRFLLAMRDGEISKLPSMPYVRGYILKISSILDIDPEPLLKAYKESGGLGSGEKDKLPYNRFAKLHFNKNVVAIIVILLVIATFFVSRFDEVIGSPTLNIELPEFTNNESVLITGNITPNDKLTINGEIVYTDENGIFNEQFYLEPGLNTLEFTIKRFLGRERTIIKQIRYQPFIIQQNEQEEITQ